MDDRGNLALKIFVGILILSITFILPISLQRLLVPTSNNQEVVQTKGTIATLKIDSLPPQFVSEGTKFEYKVTYTYTGTDPVTITINERPTWLSWDSTDTLFSGTVPSDIAFFRLKFTLQAGGLSQMQDVSIEVKPKSTQSNPTDTFINASASGSWSDPFHPQVIQQNTSANQIASTNANSSEAVLGEKTSVTNAFLTEVDWANMLLFGIVLMLAVPVSIGVFMFLKSQFRKTHKRVIKTKSGLVIESES